jgi:hypothetical protein
MEITHHGAAAHKDRSELATLADLDDFTDFFNYPCEHS